MPKKLLLIVACIIILILAVIEIWTVNRLATLGGKIVQFEISKTSLIEQNEILENEISKKSSLRNIEAEAKNRGFEKATKINSIR